MMTTELEISPLRRELVSGEHLLWEGRPAKGLRLRPSDALMIPFSLMWGGFVIFWEALALSMPGPSAFMVLWGLPFCAVGAYLIIGRFFYDAFVRSRSFYGFTERRVLICGRDGTTSLPFNALPPMHLAESGRGDGEGTITFGLPLSPWSRDRSRPPPAFELIENAHSVQQRLEQVRQSALVLSGT